MYTYALVIRRDHSTRRMGLGSEIALDYVNDNILEHLRDKAKRYKRAEHEVREGVYFLVEYHAESK